MTWLKLSFIFCHNIVLTLTNDLGFCISSRCGYKKIGGQIVTKHDREISERSNGRRMMEFPPGIETGDGAATNGPQIHVSNAVYNKIR